MAYNAHHIAPSFGGFEPQRAFLFRLQIYGIPGADTIKLAVQDSFLPDASNDVIDIGYMGERRKVAGQAQFREGQVVVVDYVDQNIYGLLEEWRKLVYDPESGKIGLAAEYKKSCDLILFHEGAQERAHRLLGVWPSMLSGDRLTYQNSDVLRLNMTLVYDRSTFG